MRWVVRNLLHVLLLSAGVLSTYAAHARDLVVVDVTAACPGLSAEEVERQVMIPLEVLMAGTPGLEHIRSQSFPGLAWLRLEFRATTGRDRARQEVINHLAFAPPLPSGVTPQLSPATVANQILRYTLRGPKDPQGKDVYASRDLRILQEAILERELRLVPGVAAVLSSGGTIKRYEVHVDPDRLRRFGISLQQVQKAIAEANSNAGGDYVKQGNVALPVRAVGLLGGADSLRPALGLKDARAAAAKLRAEEERRIRELRSLVIATVNKVPVRMEDVAEGGRLTPGEEPDGRGVVIGHPPRAGWVGLSRAGASDEDDLVQGIVLLRPGEDSGETLKRLVTRIQELNDRPGRLLPGVRIEPYYQRTSASPNTEEIAWIRVQFPIVTAAERAAVAIQQTRQLLLKYPEVREVVSQVGRAEGTMEPIGFDHAQAVVLLRPVGQWPKAPGKEQRRTWHQLTEDMQGQLARQIPGVTWDITPDYRDDMQTAFTASTGQGLLKIVGRDLEGLERLAEKASRELSDFKGVSGVQINHSLGRVSLEFRVDPEKCKRWGISVADVSNVIQTAFGGLRATQLAEGTASYDVVVCLPAHLRGSEEALLDIPVDVANPTPPDAKDKGLRAQPRLRLRDLVSPPGDDGAPDPKGSFVRPGAAVIYREEGRRFLPIRFRLPTKDPDEVMAELRRKLAPLFEAPYRAVWESGS
jgi:Cu/Ag efflux pump CusA